MSDSVVVTRLPNCDVCRAKPAAYDAKTKSGPWGNLCEDCYKEHGIGLGTGLGQRLILQAPTVKVVRKETDPCEKGTVGCSVEHPAGTETECATW